MIFDEESASDAQKFLATPKLVILENQNQGFAKKHFRLMLSMSKNEMLGMFQNAFSRSLAKIGAIL